MYTITILDLSTHKTWQETYDSYYLYNKRLIKLRYSKKLVVISTREEK